MALITVVADALGLYETAASDGVFGLSAFIKPMFHMLEGIERRVQHIDRGIMADFVNEAQSRVPVRTGMLRDGISAWEENDEYVLQASAAREATATLAADADYARFVEFGTDHGAWSMPAQPYFYPAVEAALARRGLAMDDVIGESAREAGWEVN